MNEIFSDINDIKHSLINLENKIKKLNGEGTENTISKRKSFTKKKKTKKLIIKLYNNIIVLEGNSYPIKDIIKENKGWHIPHLGWIIQLNKKKIIKEASKNKKIKIKEKIYNEDNDDNEVQKFLNCYKKKNKKEENCLIDSSSDDE